MNNHITNYALAAFYVAAVFSAGCFPEDSLEWSADGSIGVVKMDELMGVVDGETGQFKPIACKDDQEGTELSSISISADGKLIAYSLGQRVQNLTDALKQVPANQVKLLDHYAKKVRARIIRQGATEKLDFAEMDVGPFKSDAYLDLLERYVCENADEELMEFLAPEAVKEGKSKEVGLYMLFVASPQQAIEKQRQPVTTSIFAIFAPKISPVNKHVAYMLYNEPYEEVALRFDLHVAQFGGDVEAMRVGDYVAPGYSWRPDGKTLVFLENSLKESSDEYSIGTLRTMEVADEQGNLLADPISAEQGSMATHSCKGEVSDLAGVVFHPFMKVQCTPSRIFFSSHAVDLPMSTIDGELRWSLYCYDQVTRSVTDILPREVSKSLGSDNAMGYFAVSPDEKRVLLPIEDHRFMIYKLGESSAVIPIEESEQFTAGQHSGDWRMMPAWKGSDRITTLVSKNSHFVVKEGQSEREREEIVVLDAEGKFRKVLSENWFNGGAQDANVPQ